MRQILRPLFTTKLLLELAIALAAFSPVTVRAQVPTITAISAPRQVVTLGQTLALSVAATSSTTTAYQWRRNGVAIAGATNATYVISAATISDAGWYHAVVTNSSGSVMSATVFVLVRAPTSQVVVWGDPNNNRSAVPSDLTDAVQVVAGRYNVVALKADGTVAKWDYGYSGSESVTDLVSVAVGDWHYVGLKSDGTVVQWGSTGNSVGASPAGLTGVVAIAAGGIHSLALKSDGTVIAWGNSSYGATAVPDGLSGVVEIAAGYGFSLARKVDGTVIGWGYNSAGQSAVPPGLSNVARITAGADFALAAKTDGSVVGWGANGSGQLNVPGVSSVIGLAAGSSHTVALKAAGSMAVWGSNTYGESSIPVGMNSVVGVAAGQGFSVVLRNASADTTPVISTQPVSQTALIGQDVTLTVTASAGTALQKYQWQKDGVAIAGATNAKLVLPRVSADAAGAYSAIVSDWIGSATSQAANVTISSTPAITLSATGRQILTPGQTLTISATTALTGPVTYQWRKSGRDIVGATSASYTLSNVRWGDAGVYQVVVTNAVGPVVSKGTYVGISTPVQVRAWGENSAGQATPPPGLDNVLTVSAGLNHSLAVKADGTVVAWGSNAHGECTIPTGLSNVIAVAAGAGCSAALTIDGAVVRWGVVNYTPTGLAGVIAIVATPSSTLLGAIKSDGSLIAWDQDGERTDVSAGRSNVAALALGINWGVVLRSDGSVQMWVGSSDAGVPSGLVGVTRVAAVPDYSQRCAFALNADGSVITWGNASYGQMQLPTALSSVTGIAASTYAAFAVKSDGTVVQWGSFGQSVPSDLDSVVSIFAGVSHVIVLRDTSSDAVPVITTAPASQQVTVGQSVTLAVTATGGGLSYQWRKNGTAISGATKSTFTLSSMQQSDVASYDVVVSNYLGSTTSAAGSVSLPPAVLTNLSSRLTIPKEGVTAYFRIDGTTSKKMLLRAVGPALSSFGVSGVLANPALEVLDASGAVIASNDDWSGADVTAAATNVGAFPLSTGSRDAALVATLSPGFYSVRSYGVGGTTGVGLVEIYSADTTSTATVTYLGVRSNVGTGSDTLIAGFSLAGAGSAPVLVRAAGPALIPFGQSGVLSDPYLSIFNSSGSYIAGNDNWASWQTIVTSTVGAFGAVPFADASRDSASYLTVNSGSYTGQVSGINGGTGTALFEVFDAGAAGGARSPFVYTAPASLSAAVGQNATLSVIAGGSGTLSYQWRKNGVAIDGATGAAVPFASIAASDAGSYDVVVSNSAGSVTTPAATLTIIPPVAPSFLSNPSSQTVVVGQNVMLYANASGQPTPTYQWRKAGVAIAGATTSSLYLSGVQLTDAATYDVVATNAGGTATSTAATLTVTPPVPPTITTQPPSGLLNPGNAYRFYVNVTGTYPFTYQWRKNGVPIPGATTYQYSLVAPSGADAAGYDVVVSNAGGSVTSALATLSFGQLPVANQFGDRWLRSGDPLSLAIAPVSGSTYQWYKNGASIPAATTTTFSIGSVTASDLGNYSVVVSDGTTTTTRGPVTVGSRGSGPIGNLFVAVGTGGAFYTSPDGVTWMPRSSTTTSDLQAVASNGVIIVAVGANGSVVTSTDGLTWTAQSSNVTGSLNGIVAGPDRFVAVGDNGRVQVSTDGQLWYMADSRTYAALNAVTYGNGTYIMVGATGSLFTSPDGFNWTNRNSETRNNISFVAFSSGQFWALTSANQLLSSPDGIMWTVSAAVLPSWFRNLASNGQRLVLVGDGGQLQTSTDARAWTPAALGTTANLRGITWTGADAFNGPAPTQLLSDANFRIVGQPRDFSVLPGKSASFSVMTTGGGQAYQWSKNGTAIPGATQSTLTLSSVSSADVADYTVVITASAGTLTSNPAKLGLIGSGALGRQFISVGSEGAILTSADGSAFVSRASQPATILRAVAASAFRAVAVGRLGTAAISNDGVTWAYCTLPAATQTMRGIAAGPTQFVAVGSLGVIQVSIDQGNTWQLVPSGTTAGLWSVAWNGATFLAVGEGGIVLTSADGFTWSPATSPTAQRLYGVIANGSAFIAVTEDGKTFSTVDSGATWAAGTVSGALWVRGAAVNSSGLRIAVGDNGIIAASATGSDWLNVTSPVSDRLYGITWTGLPPSAPVLADSAVDGPALRITTQPQSISIPSGGTAAFSAQATGVAPLTYRWQKNGVTMAGAAGPVLIIANVQSGDAGSYSVAVTNPTGMITSSAATLTVTPASSGVAPAISVSPQGRSLTVGGSTSFSVVASGTLPLSYQWRFNGQPIPGAVSSSFALTNVQLANGGSYTVTVTNAYGAATSSVAVVTVNNATGAPVITNQPLGQSVSAGSDVSMTVIASGTGALSYQWRKNGTSISGATNATLILTGVTTADAATYSVGVSNTAGTAVSDTASLTVVPAGMSATHGVVGSGYVPSQTITISCTLSYVGTCEALGWDVLLPAGWSFVSTAGNLGDVKPQAGDTQLLSWAWSTQPTSPVTFTYTLNVPADAAGPYTLSALAIVRQGGVPIQLTGRPDPLVMLPVSSVHSADTDGDGHLGLLELTRVIELYNARCGTTRTGGYAVQAGSEDGFAPDRTTAATASVVLAKYHSADSDHDGRIGLLELTRVIELYNFRTGTARTGQYHAQAGTEDGFAPGPSP